MRDITLRQNVLDELAFEPSLDAAHIGVAVDDGIVTLSGHVGNYAEKVAAEHAVQRIKGVRGFAQEIEVRYAADKKTADDQIAKRALDIIAWDTTVPDDKILVKVEHGWLSLSGEVSWYFQRSAAENAVRKLSGVVGVTNLITVRPHLDATSIKHRIEDALKRNAEVEAAGIRVEVVGGKVTLEGRVRAWHEREAAERAAWGAPGVSAVEDRLMLG
ncbi:osmotically-inducible protein OsmY [Humitalea rosea]|uniref:Osmotically-inducible protein OsmY n=1 Tax=Humitalea rosea TaxID=990373 RepID=A0A2W7KGG8_9PROT|nr:BON domain-containing protein [Humitalea rosea]PZW46829.1 osmotically-inducible protein OsmY [Humitalea rosea]